LRATFSVVGLPHSVVTQETLSDQLDNADTADGASLIREAAEQMPDSATILIAKILADPSGEMSALDLPASTGATKSRWRI
jgi:hypothetical protein